jgi:DNA-binding transcriptional LysR family regulator
VQWDDLRVFLAVAQGGSLRKAARALRLGQPTIGRHLHQLELSVGAGLFERAANGHRLTHEARSCWGAAPLSAATSGARSASWRGNGPRESSRRVCLRGPTRTAISPFLSARVIDPDLDRCEADLIVRDGLPARGRLVRAGLGAIAGAIYGADVFVDAHPEARTDARWRRCPWVAYDVPHEYFRPMAWLAKRLGDRVARVRASRIALRLEAIRAGAGLGILPCFIGDALRG